MKKTLIAFVVTMFAASAFANEATTTVAPATNSKTVAVQKAKKGKKKAHKNKKAKKEVAAPAAEAAPAAPAAPAEAAPAAH